MCLNTRMGWNQIRQSKVMEWQIQKPHQRCFSCWKNNTLLRCEFPSEPLTVNGHNFYSSHFVFSFKNNHFAIHSPKKRTIQTFFFVTDGGRATREGIGLLKRPRWTIKNISIWVWHNYVTKWTDLCCLFTTRVIWKSVKNIWNFFAVAQLLLYVWIGATPLLLFSNFLVTQQSS